MIRNKLSTFVAALAMLLLNFACTDLDVSPESSILQEDRLPEIYAGQPEKIAAQVDGMLSYIGKYGQYDGTHGDIAYAAMCLYSDMNGADMVCYDDGYNWFSGSQDYSDRTEGSRETYIPFYYCYSQIKMANDIIQLVGEPSNETEEYYVGQAYAVRAFDYLTLAPRYQFKYVGNEDLLSVPLVTENTQQEDINNNPRATQREVYELILSDLGKAIKLLDGKQRTARTEINVQIAYGLRARAHLLMENWADAAADAEKAMEGFSPYSIAAVSQPSFYQIKDWMWGLSYTPDVVSIALRSWPSHLGSFTGYGYTSAVGMYKSINSLLYDQIPYTDVRKGWWVDADGTSPNVPKSMIDMFGLPAYGNLKHGQSGGYGDAANAGDFPLMRVEEMKLIQAEAKGRLNEAEGKALLQDFVKTYRDPSYDISASPRTFIDEVWFQRRVELWGEGFAMFDIMRLGKPVVRFTAFDGVGESNHDAAHRFNIQPDNAILLYKIPRTETNANKAAVQNTDGVVPKLNDFVDLRDGVTDFPPVVAAEVSVESVELDVTADTISLGDSLILKATVLPARATNKKVTWTSDKENIASVDTTGKVKGKAVGEATITVTTVDGNKTATCKIMVKDTATTPVTPTVVPVTGVTLNAPTKELTVGEKFTLVATVAPAEATNKQVSWDSNNKPVATVDANGEVTAVAAGEATITVTTEDGGKTATCVVTVKAPAPTTYAITIGTFSNGTVTASKTADVAAGEEITLTVTPETGYQLKAGTLKAYKTGEPATEVTISAENKFTMPAHDVTVEAEFELIPVTKYTIAATANPTGGGTISGAGEYDDGASVTLTATPNAGYRFVKWTEGGSEVSTEATYSFSATANRTLEAEFEAILVASITVATTAPATLAADGTLNLAEHVTVAPADALNKTVNYSGNNDAAATVNGTTGVVTGVATGSVTITITATDGSGVSATHTITVE